MGRHPRVLPVSEHDGADDFAARLNFLIPAGSGSLEFFIEDPDNLFASEAITSSNARFAGGGIPSGPIPESVNNRFSGDFYIDLVGFPSGTTVDMNANVVPEPASVALLGTGLVAAAVRRIRRRAR